ncbi:hypothetical protein [Aneurinibacillus migulanus]|uniref:hypothetical protein n=1 Tax=Aneurinibacillus migulanus TaxID=47500 RepID=UPI001269C570|nr:hypothetical protein [Aneurinibacillus migulanus]
MEGGDSEKEEVGCALRSSRRKASVSFSNRYRPSFFSYLSLQEFVDLSNQMYIVGMSYEENTNLIYRFSLSFPHTKNPNNGLFYKGPLFGLQFSSRGAVSFVKKIFIMKRSFK